MAYFNGFSCINIDCSKCNIARVFHFLDCYWIDNIYYAITTDDTIITTNIK